MQARRNVHVHAIDPITAAGLRAQLQGHPDIELIELDESADVESVAVAAADTLSEPVMTMLRKARRYGCRRVVLVSQAPTDLDLLAAIELGVCAILPRGEATGRRLARSVLGVASGEAALPADLLGRLIDAVSRIQTEVLAPRGLRVNGMADREVRILRLVADGLDTREIASTLNYSERTVKNVLHDVTTRFQLRNRSQAVAYGSWPTTTTRTPANGWANARRMCESAGR
jgi:DNA-binding NarL/FixJ family response regulator